MTDLDALRARIAELEHDCPEATLEVTQDEADLARKAAAWDAVGREWMEYRDDLLAGTSPSLAAEHFVKRIAAALSAVSPEEQGGND